MEYTLRFSKVAEAGNPPRSGYYIAVTDSGYFSALAYSAVYNAWNTFDTTPIDEVERYRFRHVIAWADIAGIRDSVMEACHAG